jgi:hypothetical protein
MIRFRAEDASLFRASCEMLFYSFLSSFLLASLKDDAPSVISTGGDRANWIATTFDSNNTSYAIYRKEDSFTLNGARRLSQSPL